MKPFFLSLMLSLPLLALPGGTVFLKGRPFIAEVAETDREKAQGLMHRPSLAKDRCMFFVYEQDAQHAIWMKNCLIALDVLWVREDGTIVELYENAPPCSPMLQNDCPSYGGKRISRHFIEFPAGTLRRLKVKVGDKVGWELQLKDGRALSGGLRGTQLKGKKGK